MIKVSEVDPLWVKAGPSAESLLMIVGFLWGTQHVSRITYDL